MSRPTYVQMEKLVQFLEENPGIAKGHLRSAQARQQTKLKWDEVTTTLNSLGGAIKDAKSWAKFWADKKYALKKLVAQRNTSASRTGGGVDNLQPLSELDERLIFVMGGSSFAQGDQEFSVPLIVPTADESVIVLQEDPIPSTSQAVQLPPASPASAPTTPRRSPRIRQRRLQQSQLHTERQRLIRIEERRVEAEVANATGWGRLVQAIDNLANAIIISGERIAEALNQNRNGNK